MNNTSLSRLSLIITGIGCLAWLTSLVLGQQTKVAESMELLRVSGLIILIVGVIAWIVAWREQVLSFSRTRQARYGAQAVILSLSVMGIVALLNYLAHRHNREWDLTANQSFTLSEQSQKILSTLPQDTKITAFYRSTHPQRMETLNRLESYHNVANGRISIEMVDPERQPGLALRYNVANDGTVVLESKGARKDLLSSDESQITSALLAITRPNKPVVYFLSGHKELDPESSDPRLGLSNMKQKLEAENYEVKKLSLAATGTKIPSDARVIVVAGPEIALTPHETKSLERFIQNQGDLMLMLPPRMKSGLEPLLKRFGVYVGDNILVDPARNIQNDITVPAFTEYAAHPVTKALDQVATFLPLARTISLAQKLPTQVQGEELMKSTPASWAETNLQENALIGKDEADPAGPLPAAVAITISANPPKNQAPHAQSRLVVVGNAMFAANWFSRVLGNGDFFLNSIAWLSESDDLITIRSKTAEDRSLMLTKQQESLVSIISLVLMPGLMLFIGFWIWWKRR